MEPVEITTGGTVEAQAVEVKDANADELLARANEIGEQLRKLIVDSKRVSKPKGMDPHQDPTRSLSLAQMNLQVGFMWLRRALHPTKEF